MTSFDIFTMYSISWFRYALSSSLILGDFRKLVFTFLRTLPGQQKITESSENKTLIPEFLRLRKLRDLRLRSLSSSSSSWTLGDRICIMSSSFSLFLPLYLKEKVLLNWTDDVWIFFFENRFPTLLSNVCGYK